MWWNFASTGSPPLDNRLRTTLLDLLREQLHLTGTKKGCDHGLCGACTVAVDGERDVSCLTLAASIDGSDVLTIEGIADGGRTRPAAAGLPGLRRIPVRLLHSGQISSAHAMLAEHARGDLTRPRSTVPRDDVVKGCAA